jgi:hypothetical protein
MVGEFVAQGRVIEALQELGGRAGIGRLSEKTGYSSKRIEYLLSRVANVVKEDNTYRIEAFMER